MAVYYTVTILLVCAVACIRASFEASEAASVGSATAAGSGLLKQLWEQFGNSMGSVNQGLGSVSGDNLAGSTRSDGTYPPRNTYNPNSPQYPDTPRGNYNPNSPQYPDSPRNYPDTPRTGNYPNTNRGEQDYNGRRPATNQANAVAPRPRVSTERSGQNRFPDPTRIYDNVERETTVMLRVAPVLSQSTRNTPYEIVEAIFHGPWSWEYAAQHVYALHWDLEYRFDPFGDTVFTFGSRKESDGKLWGSLDKKAFTEMPAKYFFLGNITTSPKAAAQAAFDNPLNGQTYDVISVNCQTWAIEHCKIMSEELYLKMKNFPTLLESTKYAVLWAQSAIASTFYGTSDGRTAPPPPVRADPTQLW